MLQQGDIGVCAEPYMVFKEADNTKVSLLIQLRVTGFAGCGSHQVCFFGYGVFESELRLWPTRGWCYANLL